ncbi:GNAT family N-acetyltransferase [Roseovarius sp. SYSU LYC5161]|uniref:GNAT family N-acetyltransferase n=1 Tax=Roseovarius halophilus (ex Wu et al. 2025) TaxID=3376060 RepID=UPI0028714BE1|nr:N-acetyltransferase [Roseovarius sp.]
MHVTCGYKDRADSIIELFTATFADAEGAEEGALIGTLVRSLFATTAQEDLHVFCSHADDQITGCIMFSRLVYEQETRTVFLMAPVAVRPGWQGRGIGRALIRHGLDEMQKRGADVVITYGDPAYYGRVGFAPIPESEARPPLPLAHPEGWLAHSLTGGRPAPLQGASRCVAAFDDPAYW